MSLRIDAEGFKSMVETFSLQKVKLVSNVWKK